MTTTAIKIENADQIFRVGFWLNRTQVLFDVNLEVPEKSIFGFLGANGAGKTTLIHLITGLRRPTRGQVSVFGRHSDTLEAKMRLGYLPERPYFHDHLTGEGLLHYIGVLAGMKSKQIRARIPKVLSTVGMTAARRVKLKLYSKGMLQRIGIAQTLLHDPDILVLDEPMSGLDPLGRKEIRELIIQLASEGRTIFFSTHVIPDVEAICDQIALIQKGRLIGFGPIKKFLAADSSRIEIAFGELPSTVDPATWLEVESLRKIPEGFRGVVQGYDRTERVMRNILDAKGRLFSMNPVRPSLEDLFGEAPQGGVVNGS